MCVEGLLNHSIIFGRSWRTGEVTGFSIWCTDSDVNDSNHLLQVLRLLIYVHKFPFLAFPSALTTFPCTFTCQQSIPQTLHSCACRHLFNQSHGPFLLFFSSRDVLGSQPCYLSLAFSAVYLASQLLLWIVFLLFPHLLTPSFTPFYQTEYDLHVTPPWCFQLPNKLGNEPKAPSNIC